MVEKEGLLVFISIFYSPILTLTVRRIKYESWLCPSVDSGSEFRFANGCFKEGGGKEIFEDHASGTKADRDGLRKALEFIRRQTI